MLMKLQFSIYEQNLNEPKVPEYVPEIEKELRQRIQESKVSVIMSYLTAKGANGQWIHSDYLIKEGGWEYQLKTWNSSLTHGFDSNQSYVELITEKNERWKNIRTICRWTYDNVSKKNSYTERLDSKLSGIELAEWWYMYKWKFYGYSESWSKKPLYEPTTTNFVIQELKDFHSSPKFITFLDSISDVIISHSKEKNTWKITTN